VRRQYVFLFSLVINLIIIYQNDDWWRLTSLFPKQYHYIVIYVLCFGKAPKCWKQKKADTSMQCIPM
jgi:hypothetical protein